MSPSRSRNASMNDAYISDAERTDITNISQSTYLKSPLRKPNQHYDEPPSVRIEDFDDQLKNTARSEMESLKINGEQYGRRTPVVSDAEKSDRKYRDSSKSPQKPPQAPRKYQEARKALQIRGMDSELDTARTDDLIYAGDHVIGGNVYHTSYLNGYDLDSDMDTARTSEVRNKFRVAMANSKSRAYTPSDVSDDDVGERQYREYIAKKSTENARLARVDAIASDVEEVYHQDEYCDEIRDEVDRQSVHTREAVSPFFYDNDDITSLDEDCKVEASEIHRESRRIAREMSDERRKRLLQQQQYEARVVKTMERQQPVKEPVKAKASERKQVLRPARSLDRLPRTPAKSPETVKSERVPVERIEKAVVAKEIKEKLVELQFLCDTIDKAKMEKRTLIKKLRSLRQTYDESQNEIKMSHMSSWESKQRAEKLKTELSVLEFNVSQTQQELDETEKLLASKKDHIEQIEQRVIEHLERLKNFEELGMTAEEIKEIMNEKTRLVAVVGKQEAIGEERDLLNKKLAQMKEELFESDKRSRVRIENLETKVDDLQKMNGDLQTDKQHLQQQLRMLEEKHSRDLDEKILFINEKQQHHDNLRQDLEDELNKLKYAAEEESVKLKQEIEDLQVRNMKLRENLDVRSDDNTRLVDQIAELQCDLNRENRLREKETAEHKDELARLEAEHEAVCADIRQRLYTEKHTELREAYDLFAQERCQLAAKQESKLSEQLAFHHEELMARDEEHLQLKEQIRSAEENARINVEKVQTEATSQLESDLETERQKLDEEHQRILYLEITKITDECEKKVQQAKDELARERSVSKHLESAMEIVKHELDDQRNDNRQAYKEKLDVISRLKQSALEERDNAVEQARAVAIDEGNREIEKLRLQLEVKDEEIERMRSETHSYQQKEVEIITINEKQDKTIVHEINEDCKKTAVLLGVKPRKAVTKSSDSGVHAALANFRASNESLRGYVLELKAEIDSQRSVLFNIQREKEEALSVQKEKLLAEKTEELDILKERLIKDHMEELVRLQERSPDKMMTKALMKKDTELKEIQGNMSNWKEEVAEKFAKKFEEELARELEKRTKENKRTIREKERTLLHQQRDNERLEREVKHLAAVAATTKTETETVELLRHLQERVKELRAENNQLKGRSVTSFAGKCNCECCL